MTYRLEGDRYAGTFAELLEHDLARAWMAGCGTWFGPDRRPLPAAPKNGDLALLETPIGTAVAKRRLGARLARIRGRAVTRSFRIALRLAAAGVQTALPWAALRPKHGGAAAFLVQEYVEAPTLHAFPGDPRAVTDALARSIARLHGRGFRHRDLKAPNLLVLDHDTDAPAILFLDLDGARARRDEDDPPAVFPFRTRARDLGRLVVSLTTAEARKAGYGEELLRELFVTYAAAFGRGEEAQRVRSYAQRWATAHVAGNLRKGRPIA